jgi:hypothetical protein
MPSFTYGELKWSYNHILKQARKKKSDQSEASESSESESVKSVESAKSSGFENAKNQNRFEVEERERRNSLEAGHQIMDYFDFNFNGLMFNFHVVSCWLLLLGQFFLNCLARFFLGFLFLVSFKNPLLKVLIVHFGQF